MRVLIINELAKSGGAEMQTIRECKLLKKFGNESMIVTLDPNYKHGWINYYHYNISKTNSYIASKIQMLFANKDIVKELREIINDFNPDYIHLNNTKENAISIYEAVKGYKCFRTIRDYGAVCPKSQSVYKNKKICNGYTNCTKCIRNCLIGKANPIKGIWKWLCFKRRNSAQKKSITNFVCPSQMLTDYCNKFGLNTTCINNPFDFDMLKDQKKQTKFNKKIYLYYGQIIDFKGIEQLLEAFYTFSESKEDVELHLVGTLPDLYSDRFYRILDKYNRNNIIYFGKLEYKEMLEKLSKVYAVIIPSLWMENYPNTALEATAVGCLVLGSERGGMKEIINSDDLIFHVLDNNDFVNKLNYSYLLSEEEYKIISKNGQQRVRHNNSFDKYYERLKYYLENVNI